jgi:arylsulfatase A-like enzyme
VHLFDPHTPYSPPEAFVQEFLARTGLEHPPRKADPPTVPVYFDDRRTLEEIPPASRWHAGVTSIESLRFSYHLGVAYADHLCERLVDALAAADALDDTALLLTADHGESLGEHGIWFDHQGLFRETLHVPLYLRLPGAALAGERVGTRVTGVDVAPTLLALAGLRPRADLSGADLAALARKAGGAAEDRRVFFAFSDMHQVGFHDGEAHFFTTLTDRLRYGTSLVVTDGRTVPHKADPIPRDKHFLYDPAADPALTRDVSAERPGETAAAHAELERWRASLDRKQSTRREVSADEEEGLRKMGYTGD